MSETTRERGRWSPWFIASLCFNFFLIGVIVMGLVVARNRMINNSMGGGGGGGLPPQTVLQMLPASGAVKMCDVLASRVENFRRYGREVGAARRELFKVFRTEPYDSAALRAALTRLTDAQVATLKEREAVIADVVDRLSPEERRAFTREIIRSLLTLTRPQNLQAQGSIRSLCEKAGAPGARDLPR